MTGDVRDKYEHCIIRIGWNTQNTYIIKFVNDKNDTLFNPLTAGAANIWVSFFY